MRLRICCGCVIDGQGRIGFIQKQKGIAFELQTGPPPLREQPRRIQESIALDNFTSKTTKSTIERLKEATKLKKTSFSKTSNQPSGQINSAFSISSEGIHNINTKSRSASRTFFLDSSSKFPTIVSDKKRPVVNSTSNFTYISKNGEQNQMTFEEVAPGHFCGVFKDHQFTIVNGELISKDDIFNEVEEDLIMKNYLQATLAMQQGLMGLEEKVLNSLNQKLPVINSRRFSKLSIPNYSNISVNYTAENGERSRMTFKQIKPGLFRGTCNSKVFSIANGQVLPLRRSDFDLDKELILNTFLRAMMGMQQTEFGLSRGEWALETRLSGNQLNPIELLKAACPERRSLVETESLKIHNEYRRIHRVPPLVHSERLCQMAREWAEHLALKDSLHKRPDGDYGENLYHSHRGSMDARKIISSWYNEINSYDFKNPRFTNETEHFTQLVWKDTREMGTGIAQIGDKVWMCCYYHPPGNGLSKPFEDFVLKPDGVS